MSGRWRLNRAGILNVYQYGDEVLRFGGGRLLLRGVNGSGKSTAMNMLLPFLIEADTRRIDAAGEQSAVLRSWMLSGRDEQQPVGYLWIEFARPGADGEEHLVCGCGIKANRSTDRVTTWWFLTDRRPGVDLALMEDRVPLGVDSLRATLGAHAVFTHEQRSAYRQAVREALFGGRDLDQHLRLLHVVRSPRVGDRIDSELPEYLRDALPQLSDAALDDAAQPLEDLEEHRRNVHALARTAETLEGLRAVYGSYAAGELRRRAAHVGDLHRAVEQREDDAGRARRAEARAVEQRRRADEAVRTLQATIQRLAQEIEALQASPAYQRGLELDDLRSHVHDLRRQAEDARRREHERNDHRERAASAVRVAADATADDHGALHDLLTELGHLAVARGLSARVGELPALAVAPVADGVSVPEGDLDVEPVRITVGAVQAAAALRRIDVDEVSDALDEVDRRHRELVRLEQEHRRALTAADDAEGRLTARRDELAAAVHRWRGALAAWIAALDDAELQALAPPIDVPDLLDRRAQMRERCLVAVNTAIDDLVGRRSRLAARRDREEADVRRGEAELDELRARTHPDPPRAPWQRPLRRACLADVVDFADHLTDPDRAGLEAALEASGLLGAELGDDGMLHLESGELLVLAGAEVDAPLAALLRVSLADGAVPAVDGGAVQKVLDSISTDLGSASHTAVTVGGGFRVGALHGHHTKEVAEHVGAAARRATLARRIASLEAELEAAREVLRRTGAELAELGQRIGRLTEHRAALPPTTEVDRAEAAGRAAEDQLALARERVDAADDDVRAADEEHAAAVSEATRRAAVHALPMDRAQLLEVRADLGRADDLGRRALALLGVLTRSHRQWHERAHDWVAARAAAVEAAGEAAVAHDAHQVRAMRLATLEDAVGTDYQEVLGALAVSRADLEVAEADLRAADTERTQAIEHATSAARDVADAARALEVARRQCVDALRPLQRALAVAGLLEAARAGAEPAALVDLPVVEESPEGAAALAGAVLALLPPAAREAATADGVRQSLRQRREQLGAGWDAEDSQPDDAVPLAVTVTGPLGRMPLAPALTQVRSQHAQQSSLLTAKQDQALRNLLQGLVAKEVAEKMHAAGELVGLMNHRLAHVSTAHGIGARLTWRRRADLAPELVEMIDLLRRPPDLRTPEHDAALQEVLSRRLEQARRDEPERRYRELVGEILDYRDWHEIGIVVRRPGRDEERLTRRTPLSEGEKKIVSYLPLFAAVAGSYDALAESSPQVPRFVLLDDAFAKVSEDNHAQLFGLLVELDLDFIATSERLWGTHATVPELAITEVLRDASLGVIVLEHAHWNGRRKQEAP